jgi:hypothetical protein
LGEDMMEELFKFSIGQKVWFFDGANRLMQGMILKIHKDKDENNHYFVMGRRKSFWLNESEIYFSSTDANKNRS